ncbi:MULTISPECIES: hypothetical protein [Aeromonas]|uniref:hypothetical protein n=1 Tax=Aeromonas TaxID=642 RepID=UPI00366F4B15
MPSHCFLFTYSVSPLNTNHKVVEQADKVRKKIAELNQWTKLDSVETTFVGELYLVESTLDGKRREAENDVTNVLKDLLDEMDAYSSVWVDVALLVDGLGEHIEFKV